MRRVLNLIEVGDDHAGDGGARPEGAEESEAETQDGVDGSGLRRALTSKNGVEVKAGFTVTLAA